MELKFIETGNIRLAYIEKNSEKINSIFFIHGNSGSHRTWNKQLNYELLRDFRLIAFDLPAHGQSGESNDPMNNYSPKATGKIMATAVNSLANESPYILVGFSYGTNVIAEMLNYDINPDGILLSAPCVTGSNHGMDKIFKPGDTTIFFQDEAQETVIRSFFSGELKFSDSAAINDCTNDFMNVRPPFRTTLLQCAMNGKISDEVELIKKLNIPVLSVFGKEDSLVNIDYLDDAPFQLWNKTVNKISQAGHFVQTDQPEHFNRLLADYCAERFISGPD